MLVTPPNRQEALLSSPPPPLLLPDPLSPHHHAGDEPHPSAAPSQPQWTKTSETTLGLAIQPLYYSS